jgi:hypothetical protein
MPQRLFGAAKAIERRLRNDVFHADQLAGLRVVVEEDALHEPARRQAVVTIMVRSHLECIQSYSYKESPCGCQDVPGADGCRHPGESRRAACPSSSRAQT